MQKVEDCFLGVDGDMVQGAEDTRQDAAMQVGVCVCE
jgi:hypothetical protein